MASENEIVVAIPELKRFIVECLVRKNVNEGHANQLAELLVEADYRGHYSHGINRLGMYLTEIEKGLCSIDGTPELISEKPSTGWVDGKNLLGPVVGNFCMDIAIKKAKETGVGWVVAKRSNHYGIAGWYALNACKHRLGLSFTNTSPFAFPTRGSKPILGVNPLSMAAPATNGDDFCLDMSTTTVALGKLEIARVKGQQIPQGWGADSRGQETHNPDDVLLRGGGLLPLGGVEQSGGYKGYGLGLMVEILCGVMAGSNWGPQIRFWNTNTSEEADLGQCFIAVDPECFAPGFHERLQTMLDTFRQLEPAQGETNVMVAGDPERFHMELCDRLNGIPYHNSQIEVIENLAKRMNVVPVITSAK